MLFFFTSLLAGEGAALGAAFRAYIVAAAAYADALGAALAVAVIGAVLGVAGNRAFCAGAAAYRGRTAAFTPLTVRAAAGLVADLGPGAVYLDTGQAAQAAFIVLAGRNLTFQSVLHRAPLFLRFAKPESLTRPILPPLRPFIPNSLGIKILLMPPYQIKP